MSCRLSSAIASLERQQALRAARYSLLVAAMVLAELSLT